MSELTPFLSERGRAASMPEGIRVWGERDGPMIEWSSVRSSPM